jgi:deoxyuridine 5''-triphosphate nucleotidohydrolase (dut)
LISTCLVSGCYGRIAPRSGLAWKNHIDVGAGVIDEDYRGNVGVVLFNHSDQDFKVNKGDRIAQLICQRIEYPVLQEVTNLNNTERGAGGFGSTGTK